MYATREGYGERTDGEKVQQTAQRNFRMRTHNRVTELHGGRSQTGKRNVMNTASKTPHMTQAVPRFTKRLVRTHEWNVPEFAFHYINTHTLSPPAPCSPSLTCVSNSPYRWSSSATFAVATITSSCVHSKPHYTLHHTTH
jgi:hypothetical protein